MAGHVEGRGVGQHLEGALASTARSGQSGGGSGVAFIGVVGISSRS